MEDHLKKFELFPKLPLELRRQIWSLVPEPRLVPVDDEQVRSHRDTTVSKFTTTLLPPSILGVCRESRTEGMRVYTLRLVAEASHPPIWIDPVRDVIILEGIRIDHRSVAPYLSSVHHIAFYHRYEGHTWASDVDLYPNLDTFLIIRPIYCRPCCRNNAAHFAQLLDIRESIYKSVEAGVVATLHRDKAELSKTNSSLDRKEMTVVGTFHQGRRYCDWATSVNWSRTELRELKVSGTGHFDVGNARP